MHASTKRSHGFTLLELLVTVAVVAILALVAVPGFTDMMVNIRLKGYANSMMSSLFLARSEAIKRNSRVVLCKSSNGTSCTGNWQDGWIVFADANNNGTVDAGEELIQHIDALASGYTLSGGTDVASYVSYTPQGVTKLTNNAMQQGTFTLCPPAPAPSNQGRSIAINPTGRPSIATITSCS